MYTSVTYRVEIYLKDGNTLTIPSLTEEGKNLLTQLHLGHIAQLQITGENAMGTPTEVLVTTGDIEGIQIQQIRAERV